MNLSLPREISREFIYRCMGFGNNIPNGESLKQIEKCSGEILTAAEPKAVYREFELGRHSETGQIYVLNESNVLEGDAIKKHLSDCKRCVLMGVTLGSGVDRLIRRKEITDMSEAMALDACASSLIEDLCDILNKEMEESYEKQGIYMTERFSPGYGDMPLSCQQVFSKLLDMQKKIGLTENASHLLIPRKSVTAVIGLKENMSSGSRDGGREGGQSGVDDGMKDSMLYSKACNICNMRETCDFRKNGGSCGRK